MAVYNTIDEIRKAKDKHGWISGIVRYEFQLLLDGSDIELINDDLSNQLVGEDYGYLLTGMDYTLVGCDTINQQLLIKINADTQYLFNVLEEQIN
jgi:hypothetical protein